jgi:hypothetical protein
VYSDVISDLKLLLDPDKQLIEGHRQFAAEEYSLSMNCYTQAENAIGQFFSKPVMLYVEGEANLYADFTDAQYFRKSLVPSPLYSIKRTNRFGEDFPTKLAIRYDDRANLVIDSPSALKQLEELNVAKTITLETTKEDLREDLVSLMLHVEFLLLPICMGDVAAAMGDYVAAANYYDSVAHSRLKSESLLGDKSNECIKNQYKTLDLPYSWNKSIVDTFYDYPYLNVCETSLLLLRRGSLYLDWADQLYRTDQEAEIYRARELYKAILYSYGLDPLEPVKLEPLPTPQTNSLLPNAIGEHMSAVSATAPPVLHKLSNLVGAA